MPRRLKMHGKANSGEHGKIKARANGHTIPAVKREKIPKASKKKLIPGCGTLLVIVTALIILIAVIV